MTTNGKYAVETTVTPDQTLNEIRLVLKRYNATSFGLLEEAQRIGIAFEMHSRRVRFTMPIPQPNEYLKKVNGAAMTAVQSKGAHQKAIRSRWRALLLTIKAKLESVESGIETFEEAFMGQLVLPDGHTMAEWAAPQIESIYSSGKMPPLLPSGG